MIQPDQQQQHRFRRKRSSFWPVFLLSLLLLIITGSFWLYFAPIEPEQGEHPTVSEPLEKPSLPAPENEKSVSRTIHPAESQPQSVPPTTRNPIDNKTKKHPPAVHETSEKEQQQPPPSPAKEKTGKSLATTTQPAAAEKKPAKPASPKVRQLSVDELQAGPAVSPVIPAQSPPSETTRAELPAETVTDAQSVPVPQDVQEAGPEAAAFLGEQEREEKEPTACERLLENLTGFFRHLDQAEYIQQFELGENTQSYFLALTRNLLDNPPVVIKESDDLYTILTNMAHFFRVIGRKNIMLMKAIFDRERDKIEDVAAELYSWIFLDRCSDDRFRLEAPLAKIYEYAGFFLNTMGGRSYLFRRDSRYRLLINYYSILVIDQANRADMNRYGIDITEMIKKLAQEIELSDQLIYKENYLDQLYDLEEKYQ